MTSYDAAQEFVREVASEYEEEGYEVVVKPSAGQLPEILRDFRPDIIATRGSETVLVEVKRGQTALTDDRLEMMAKRAELIGYRVDLVFTPEPLASPLTRSRRRELLVQALGLIEQENSEAGLLLAASVLEASLR